MRHSIYGKKLSRSKNQRTALFRGLIRSLVLSESIETTEAKAKAIKGAFDTLVSKGRQNNQASLNVINSFLPQGDVSSKLISDIAPRYKTRTSGFTTMIKLGRRLGDGAMIVKLSLSPADSVTEKPKKESKKEAKEGATK